jgi:DNA-binding CsgD family transcriptional regulator
MSNIERERAALVSEVRDQLLLGNQHIAFGGQPGVGKSTVLDSLVDSITSLGETRVLHSRSLRNGAVVPYHGLRDLFTTIDVDDFALPEPQRSALLSALGRAEASDHPAHILHLAVDSIVRELGRDHFVLIAIDDIEFIDDETHHVIQYVANRPTGGAVRESYVATITSDPALTGGPAPFDLAACSVEEIVHLPPLSRSGFTSVITNATQTDLNESEVNELFLRTGGNPLWGIELAYQSPPGLPLKNVPKSLESITSARIEALPAATKEVLAVLALLQEGTWRELNEIAEVDDDDIRQAVALGVVTDRGGLLSPTHRMIAAASLDHLGADQLRLLHSRIYERSADLRQRAHHLDKATAPGPDDALATLLHDAGLRSRLNDDLSGALRFLRRAVDRTARDAAGLPERELALAEALFARGFLEESTHILELLPYERLPIARLDRALPLVLMAIAARDGEAAAEHFLVELHSRTGGDPVREAVLMAYDADMATDPELRRDLATRALRRLHDADAAPVTRHRAIGALVDAELSAGLGLNSDLLDEAQALEQQLDSVALNDSADGMRALFAYQTGDLETSRRALQRMRRRAAASEQSIMAGVFSVHLAAVEAYSGHLGQARLILDEWEGFEAFASPPPSVVAARGLTLLRLVDESPLREIVSRPHVHGSELTATITRAALTGIAGARRQRWDEAVVELERARSLSLAAGVREPGRRLWVDFALARTYVALARFDEAAVIRDFLSEISDGRRPLLDGVATRIEGLLAAADGRGAEATALLRRAVGLHSAAGFPTETALSLFELGRHLHTTRARPEAVETFERASQIAAAAGDEQLVALIEESRSPSGSGSLRELLSEREQAVAEDAAEGRTNREIAAAHFLSVRTVETQLSSAYRKLGVRSRSELTALLAKDSLG